MSGSGVISFYIPASDQPQVVSAANPLPVTAPTGTTATQVQGTAADGTAPVGNPVQVGVWDNGSNLMRALRGTTLGAYVQGAIPSGVADGGGPVKVGGRYNSTLPTFTDGQRTDFQSDDRGNIRARLVGTSMTSVDGIGGLAALSAQSEPGTTVRLLVQAPFVFNGTNFDRQRGSAGEGTIVKPYAFAASAWRNTQRLTAIGTTAIVAAGGAGVVNFLTSIQMTWQPGMGATVVQILDGATVIAEFDLEASGAGTESGQLLMTFPVPLAGTANTALNVAIDTVGPVKFNAQGYRATP